MPIPDLGTFAQQLFDKIRGALPTAQYSYDFRQPVAQAQAPTPTPKTQSSFNRELLRQGILGWSKGREDIPILSHLDVLEEAGNNLSAQGFDPYLPAIIAIRETQGGRDLTEPRYQGKIGSNNIYNIRNTGQQGNTKPFVDYPNIRTAVLGGPNGPVQSKGFVGMLLSSPQYQSFRQSKDVRDFLRVYSPPEDLNGPIDEQVGNYQHLRGFFGGPR